MRRGGLLVFALVVLASVGCDHAAKRAAEQHLAAAEARTLAGGVVHLELTHNFGAFLGMGAELPAPVRQLLLLGMVPLLIALVCLVLVRELGRSVSTMTALGLLAGGGLGNWLDRLRQEGAVTDFVSVAIGAFRTAMFNVADVAVMTGLVLVVLAMVRRLPSPPPAADAPPG
jgi:signal peptidase II